MAGTHGSLCFFQAVDCLVTLVSFVLCSYAGAPCPTIRRARERLNTRQALTLSYVSQLYCPEAQEALSFSCRFIHI